GGVFVEFVGTGALAFGLALALVVMICDFSGLTDSYRLAGVTLAIVMLIHGLAPTWVVAGERFLQVALGIIVGVIVSMAIWPSRARETLRAGLADALTGMEALFQSVIQSIHGSSAAAIETQRATVKNLLRKGLDLQVQAAHELSATVDQASITLLLHLADRVMEAIEALEISARGSFDGAYHLHFTEKTDQLERQISEGLKLLAQSTRDWKFDVPWPDCRPTVVELEDQIALVRASGASTKYPLEEVLCFYTFLFSLKNLAKELELAHAATGRIAKSTSSV
ncbi:MAG: FUSC family protein, partial [Candidatus Acidiferrales bacterium]